MLDKLRDVSFLGISFFDFTAIFVGTLLLSFGVVWFADPAGLVVGGVSGLAIVIKEISASTIGYAIPLSVTNFVLNVPLYLICLKQRGLKFIQKSVYSVVLLTVFLEVCAYIPNIFQFEGDLLPASLACGVFSGIGIGLVMRAGGTTGGTEMLAAIIKYIRPHFPISKLIFIIDALIIALGFFIFGAEATVYAVISVFICSKLIDMLLEGGHHAKAVYIISTETEKISQAVFKALDRGNTGIQVRGMFTRETKEMLMVVVSKKEVPQLRQIVAGIDPRAFVILTEVSEVLGEGFIESYDANSLGG